MLIAGAGMFGVLLFLNFYMQQNLGFSPVRTGLAFLPMVALTMAGNNVSAMVLMPRTGPRPLVAAGMLLAGGGGAWLTQLGAHSGYATGILPAVLLVGAGLGLIFAPVVTTGTSAVPPADTGVASATVNAGNQLGGSIGTSLLNTIFAGAITAYVAAHAGPATFTARPAPALITAAQLHAYHTRVLVGRRHLRRRRRHRRRSSCAPARCPSQPVHLTGAAQPGRAGAPAGGRAQPGELRARTCRAHDRTGGAAPLRPACAPAPAGGHRHRRPEAIDSASRPASPRSRTPAAVVVQRAPDSMEGRDDDQPGDPCLADSPHSRRQSCR